MSDLANDFKKINAENHQAHTLDDETLKSNYYNLESLNTNLIELEVKRAIAELKKWKAPEENLATNEFVRRTSTDIITFYSNLVKVM